MKSINYLITILSAAIFLSCSDSVSPESSVDFGYFDLHYSISGSWIVQRTLDIYKNGIAVAKSNYGKDSVKVIMTENAKREISGLVNGFSDYNRYYEPDDIWTDQAYERIIFENDNVSDTVASYDRVHGNLPARLNKLFDWLSKYHLSVTEKTK